MAFVLCCCHQQWFRTRRRIWGQGKTQEVYDRDDNSGFDEVLKQSVQVRRSSQPLWSPVLRPALFAYGPTQSTPDFVDTQWQCPGDVISHSIKHRWNCGSASMSWQKRSWQIIKKQHCLSAPLREVLRSAKCRMHRTHACQRGGRPQSAPLCNAHNQISFKKLNRFIIKFYDIRNLSALKDVSGNRGPGNFVEKVTSAVVKFLGVPRCSTRWSELRKIGVDFGV